MAFFTYIMASQPNGTLYVGHTDDLARRAWEHREGLIPGFTSKYGVKLLVWYEVHDERHSALPANGRSRNGKGPGKSD